MFDDRLQNSKRPAETLTHQAAHVIRRLGKCKRAVLIYHFQSLLQQAHGQVGIFGDRVHVVTLRRLYRSSTPRADRPRNNGDHIEQIERAAIEVLAGDVFERLPARPKVDAVSDLGISCDGAYPRIGHARDQL